MSSDRKRELRRSNSAAGEPALCDRDMGTAQSGMCLIPPGDFLQRLYVPAASVLLLLPFTVPWLVVACRALLISKHRPLCVPLALSHTHVCTRMLVRELVSKKFMFLSPPLTFLSVSVSVSVSRSSSGCVPPSLTPLPLTASHIPSTHVHHVAHHVSSRPSCGRQRSSRSRSDALSAGSFRARRMRHLLCRCSPRRARSRSLPHSLSLSLFLRLCLLPLSSSPSCEALRRKPW